MSENALRREEAEAKRKDQVKNNGRTKYKGKDTKELSSKAPDGFKDNPRWKKTTKEKIKPAPKSQEKMKSPKQGILKFGRKEANHTLNSNSEIRGKKKSKAKMAQDVPRQVRFHHVPPTPPVSGVSRGSSRDAKRNRIGGAITSAGMYTLFSSFSQVALPLVFLVFLFVFLFFSGEIKLMGFVEESLRFPIPSVLISDIANQCTFRHPPSVIVILRQMLMKNSVFPFPF